MNYLNKPFRAPRAFSPVDAANAFERSGGLAVFALPAVVRRVLHAVWLPVALVLALGLALLTPAGLSLAAIASATYAGANAAGIVGATIAFVAASVAFACVAYKPNDGRVHTPTLTVQQLLLDVISAFRKQVPAISMFGAQWTAKPLKLNGKYTAQIAVYGSASTYDPTTGYWNGANTARNGLVDVDVITDAQPTYPLKWQHLDGIKDSKNEYGKVMAGAGYTLGKSCIDTGFFAKMTSRFFSQENVTATADCDWDWLQAIVTAMNGKGCEPAGRVLFVNSEVAQVLSVDPRMISRDYFGEKITGQLVTGQGYRMWTNCGGFALIQEYPDLPTNNGAALTGVTGADTTDIFTKAAHGLVTGDPVQFSSLTGGSNLSTATRYFAIKASDSTFKVATSRANAQAGTAVNLGSDVTDATIAITENTIAFAGDGRAFASLAGIPEGATVMADMLGVVQTLTFDVLTSPPEDGGITMAAAKAQNPNNGDVLWCPTFVDGTNAGKQGSTATAGETAAARSVAAAATADGTAFDYAGLRISKGANA
jgi:membrane protein implicated in regulation of membrane protease activity